MGLTSSVHGNENNRALHDLDKSQDLLVLLLCQQEPDMKWRLDSGQIEALDEALADVLRRKTPAEKIQMIAAAHRTARQLIRAGVRHQHPDWDDAQVEAEVLRRLTRGAD